MVSDHREPETPPSATCRVMRKDRAPPLRSFRRVWRQVGCTAPGATGIGGVPPAIVALRPCEGGEVLFAATVAVSCGSWPARRRSENPRDRRRRHPGAAHRPG